MKSKQQATRQRGMAMGGRGPGNMPSIERAKNIKPTLLRLFSYFKAEKKYFILAAIFIILSSLMRVMTPMIVGNSIKNYIEVEVNLAKFIDQMIILLFLYLGTWLIESISGFFMTKSSNNVTFKLRNDTFFHVQRLSLGDINKNGTGDIMSRFTNDIESISQVLSNGFSGFVGSILMIVGSLFFMLMLDLKLSVAILITIPPMFWATKFIGKKVREIYRKNQKQLGRLSGEIQEKFTGLKVIKTFGREEDVCSDFEKINNEALEIGVKSNLISYILNPVMSLMTSVTLAILVGFAGYLIVDTNTGYSIGLLTAFIMYSRRFFQPIRRIMGIYNMLQASIAGAERVFEVLDTKVETREQTEELSIDGNIEFRNVNFSYEKNKPVIKNISFKVGQSETIAIVGPTGVGKTTLANLLSRFYIPDSGDIYIDNISAKDFDLNYLRQNIGFVLQDPFLFSTSINENIRYGNPNASDEDIKNACKLSAADDFIKKMPDGYETVLMERGSNLSQGERQLLAIARVIVSNPRILVLDEATSNVDTLTEVHIQKALISLMKNRTTIIIAHRLSTIKNADMVLVLKDGMIVERGTHEELLSIKGFYYELYTAD